MKQTFMTYFFKSYVRFCRIMFLLPVMIFANRPIFTESKSLPLPFSTLCHSIIHNIFQVYKCLELYSSEPTYVSTHIVNQEKAQFPAITICPISKGYKESVLQVSLIKLAQLSDEGTNSVLLGSRHFQCEGLQQRYSSHELDK